ncbi:MAG: hypothetical protein ACYC75_01075 [Minisyncoccota bacterium]
MAFPRTIPTSFVPQPASAAARKFHSDFTGAFGFLAYTILAIVFALAVGLFFYSRILDSEQTSKDAQLAKAEAAIDPTTVESFVQLRNRLDAGTTLLTNHVAFTNFFSVLEAILPTTVRFSALHLSIGTSAASPSIAAGRDIKLEGTGIARNFNALAATSNAFAVDGRIKDAIFSNFTVNKDNSVSFSLSASIDPALVAFAPASASAAASSSAPSL